MLPWPIDSRSSSSSVWPLARLGGGGKAAEASPRAPSPLSSFGSRTSTALVGPPVRLLKVLASGTTTPVPPPLKRKDQADMGVGARGAYYVVFFL